MPLFFHNGWTIKSLQMGDEDGIFHTAMPSRGPFGALRKTRTQLGPSSSLDLKVARSARIPPKSRCIGHVLLMRLENLIVIIIISKKWAHSMAGSGVLNVVM